jgi:hypothetical protein
MKTYFRIVVLTSMLLPMVGCTSESNKSGNGQANVAIQADTLQAHTLTVELDDESKKEILTEQLKKKEEEAAMAKQETNTTPGKEPDVITVQHCLIGFEGSVPGKPISRTKEEAKELAERLLKRLKDGDKFEEIINQFTDDSPPGIYKMTNNGVRPVPGAYARAGMVPAFGDTGFPLQVGEYGLAEHDSKKSPYGWHIVKRIE